MCGIVGKLSFDSNKPIDESVVRRMADKVRHRGPDGEGVYISPDRRCGLGFRRLAIIDLSPRGNQPMTNDDGSLWIVFNGEIYNFQELRKDLEKRGHPFRSNTDTECILHLYEEKGAECLKDLRGMFAFAIWDERKQELFLARDRLGKKPLKYYHDGAQFVFASELKALFEVPGVPKEIDHEAIDEYLTYQYVPHPKTGFKNIWKLAPAHYLLVKSDGTLIKKRYWQLDFESKLHLSEKEWEERITEKLAESVRLRLTSDVPLGVHLSGGIDSSLIVALMSREMKEPVKTFSIGFGESDYNELPYARLVAKKYKTDHHEFVVKPDAIELLSKLAYQYEEPYADSSALPTWYLSEVTKKYVTVALNGDGGDENFAGYTRYNAMQFFQMLKFVPAKRLLAEINRLAYALTKQKIFQKGYRFLSSYATSPVDFYLRIIDYFSQEEKNLIYTKEFKDTTKNSRWRSFVHSLSFEGRGQGEGGKVSWLDQILSTDINSYLSDDLLVKVDIASMAYGLEVRSPFLDHEFMELAAQMPSRLKMHWGAKKYLLKKIARQYLPGECIDRPKQGFGVPLEHWFRGDLLPYLREQLLDSQFFAHGFFTREGIERLIDDHANHRQNYANHLWALLILRQWLP